MAFLRTLALVVMLPVAIVACDLEFICNQGNYVIKNPDTTSYTDVNGYYENGTACVSYAEGIDAETLLVSDCGLVSIKRIRNSSASSVNLNHGIGRGVPIELRLLRPR